MRILSHSTKLTLYLAVLSTTGFGGDVGWPYLVASE